MRKTPGEDQMPGISFSGRDGMKRSTPGWSRRGSYSGLSSLLRGWGQMKANNSRWPTFNGIFVIYLDSGESGWPNMQTYHTMVSNGLTAKTLREKCISGDAMKMVAHLEDLTDIWESLDTC
jgi:hypothetical protein